MLECWLNVDEKKVGVGSFVSLKGDKTIYEITHIGGVEMEAMDINRKRGQTEYRRKLSGLKLKED